ncbi:hypothetical protein N0V82_004408 [Gnomoniopsis sp. IMI 355080]|nr:hypothetical protein N0V82_004408 [Gnomoniopsis sp. IMI 355080]
MSTSPNPNPPSFHEHHAAHGLPQHDGGESDDGELLDPDTIPVEVLVEHLLAAKRALSSVNLVQRADDLSTHARQLHEESVILGAQTAFLKRGIADQLKLLSRVHRNMIHTYDASKKEFKQLTPTMDAVHDKLQKTMDMLREIPVDPLFRPEGEAPKYLFDFVSEDQVHIMLADLKEGIDQLQANQTSFSTDLFHFDDNMRNLNNALSLSSQKSPTDYNSPPSILELFLSMTDQSHYMATNLTKLTRHFDICVEAVRITEGGAALARQKDVGEETNPVSISGVLRAQEDDVSTWTRAEVVTTVIRDAPHVDGVVEDLSTVLQEVEVNFNSLQDQSDQVKAAYAAVIQAFCILEDIGSRLESYIEAASAFVERWNNEKESIFATLGDMERLRDHWEGYASGYDSLILEVERRRAVEEKIHNIWRKAKEQVDRLVESDWKDRETFTTEVGGFIPGDLWVGMSGPLQKWEVVRAQTEEGSASASGKATSGEMPQQDHGSAATLDRGVVDGAMERIGMASSSKR